MAQIGARSTKGALKQHVMFFFGFVKWDYYFFNLYHLLNTSIGSSLFLPTATPRILKVTIDIVAMWCL